MGQIDSKYSHHNVEDKWYEYWEKNQIFHSEVDKTKKPYTIVIPPPNITGILTMGHVLNNTIQDILIRYKKMQGYNTCWVPGTDHASIATEAKVVRMLKDEYNIDKSQLTRDEFLKYCWDWKEKYGGIIIKQLRKLGVSCDWRRERFTMDDHYYKKVIEAFVKLYKEGLIYRGYRLVNWCPASKSAISDEEVEYREVNGKLWHLRYPIAGTNDYLIVATTRPETMLGDTGVAVNPNDDRYKHLVGKKVLLPLVNREIPIFADEYVDMTFGTGCVKVTPAHDPNDYEMGKKHNLEFINIMNPDATLNNNVPEQFKGLDRYEARKKVIEELQKLNLLEKIEDYNTKVGYSQRGGVPIEPYLSEQWFLKMDELAKPAIQVVKEKLIKFYPEHWVKTYLHWMENIKDWCISRQLWWGHRIPVWYHKQTGEIYCEVEPPKDIENWKQDEDVLDTWASSWLWAQDVFTTKEELEYYYPTSTLVTGPDIIFFWVARMIMAGMHFIGKIPFENVYFTSIIRDAQGRKMSKSLGNSPDPLDVINEYGADALRFTVIYLAPLGQDVLFSTEKCELGRNFANKLWNSARFLLLNKENIAPDDNLINEHIDFVDKWIISRLNSTVRDFNTAMDKFELNNAIKIVYHFVWNDFCDWYIELIKNRLYKGTDSEKTSVLTRALNIFEELLRLLHPFMPYITEELYHAIKERKEGESITLSKFPEFNSNLLDNSAEDEMLFIQDIVTAIRNIRGEMNIPPSKSVNLILKTNKLTENQITYIKNLAKVENLSYGNNVEKPKASASAIVKGCDIFIPLEGLIDLNVEKQRLEKELARLEGQLKGVIAKLSNEKFVNGAPADVVEREKDKKQDWESKIAKIKEALANLN
ncbi:MAG TPA: valine--tRNA ligase [Ignavibacteriales bacterium]|nr:valine--tRNA ligase [Ignavibacteriales bacterium]HOM65006.1 valine--tRNA ligase [Ignavibacteriales bacterium]HPD67262.1 valine--tRNA ligase [Ignavibacteriales bacterium]HRR17773.1 valine--tRNA ligase [Ignavibacteriales bacterium]HRT98539.1 valine--tRNA ligase [Ignavibacteriales bacterium]